MPSVNVAEAHTLPWIGGRAAVLTAPEGESEQVLPALLPRRTRWSLRDKFVLVLSRDEEWLRKARTLIETPAGNPQGRPGEVSRSSPEISFATPGMIIDGVRRQEVDLSGITHLVAHVPPDEEISFSADVGFIISRIRRRPRTVLIAEKPLAEEARRRLPYHRWNALDLHRLHRPPKGSAPMARYKNIRNPEELQQTVKAIIQDIHDEADPLEMNDYRRFIKKNVSIFNRAYFTAWLLKQLTESGRGGYQPRTRPAQPRRTKGAEKASAKFVESQDGGDPIEGDTQTLFVSIGKNRRVFPKDFIALLTEIDGITGEQIGQIKILDSYSFVEVNTDVADRVISQCNGLEYRGRKLTVNYARSKK
ncbi:DbpA RNA binding domain-containing protein [Alkalispirochaeta americana]|uniref:DbpA RNA binding domain-containing protein n=1 Tax=Alkalispirochaeta americana TaxID=159291 RepID=A0A1N6UGA1_9SPIO|nr:DbpA RNA binding domain-containing protein [Alkalispirochaeta americana]SIQ64501.1 DbpA RNA binding domain-containing protein [Alkalispirochaeta americana]